MSKLDEATELVERAAGAAGKLADKVAGAAGTVAKIGKEARLVRGKKDEVKQVPTTGAKQGWLERRHARKEALRQAAPALATARAYVARALFYAALITAGAVLLIVYLAKAEGGTAVIVPLAFLAFFLLLAIGFRLSFESLRPRLLKVANTSIVANSIPLNNNLALTIESSNLPLRKISTKEIHSLSKLLRHYCFVNGVPDSEIERYAQAILEGETQIDTSNKELVYYQYSLYSICHVFHFPNPIINYREVILVDREEDYRKRCDRIFSWIVQEKGYEDITTYYGDEDNQTPTVLQWMATIKDTKLPFAQTPPNIDRVYTYRRKNDPKKRLWARFFEAEFEHPLKKGNGIDQMENFLDSVIQPCQDKSINIVSAYVVYKKSLDGDPNLSKDSTYGEHFYGLSIHGKKPVFFWDDNSFNDAQTEKDKGTNLNLF